MYVSVAFLQEAVSFYTGVEIIPLLLKPKDINRALFNTALLACFTINFTILHFFLPIIYLT